MFGIGMQEMVLVGIIFLIVFGPSKLPDMARDFGRFVNEARRSVEEFKEDLASEEADGRVPRKERSAGVSPDLEQGVPHEEVAAIDGSEERVEQRQQ